MDQITDRPATRAPICPYCKRPAKLVTGKKLYPYYPKKHNRRFWECAPCKAWVGCHPGTDVALGTPADAILRSMRQDAHNYFDIMWRAKMVRDKCSKSVAREAAYKWLAGEMRLAREVCHIGMFTPGQCRVAIAICSKFYSASFDLIRAKGSWTDKRQAGVIRKR